MSLAFQMLQDPRGGHAELPPPYYLQGSDGSGSKNSRYHYEFLHRMNGLRDAYFRHLSSSEPSLKGSNEDPRFADQVQFVALHHFHPRVVREVAEAAGFGRMSSTNSSDNNNNPNASMSSSTSSQQYYKNLQCRVPWTMTAAEIRRLGLVVKDEDRVVLGQVNNDNGQPKSNNKGGVDEYYFVPNYPMDKAYHDLKCLSKAERSSADICTNVYQKAQEAIKEKQKQKQVELDQALKQKQDTTKSKTGDKERRRKERKSGVKSEKRKEKKQRRTEEATKEPPRDSATVAAVIGDAGGATAASSNKQPFDSIEIINPNERAAAVVTSKPAIEQTGHTDKDVYHMKVETSGVVVTAMGSNFTTGPSDTTPTLDDSYSLFHQSSQAKLSTTSSYQATPTFKQKLGGSNSAAVPTAGGASSSSIAIGNLYNNNSSAFSLQATDPALMLQASSDSIGFMLNRSDLTEKASGAGAVKSNKAMSSSLNMSSSSRFHASASTVGISNLTAPVAAIRSSSPVPSVRKPSHVIEKESVPPQLAARKPSQMDVDFPLETALLKRPSTSIPKLESPREQQYQYSPTATRTGKAKSMKTAEAVSQAVAGGQEHLSEEGSGQSNDVDGLSLPELMRIPLEPSASDQPSLYKNTSSIQGSFILEETSEELELSASLLGDKKEDSIATATYYPAQIEAVSVRGDSQDESSAYVKTLASLSPFNRKPVRSSDTIGKSLQPHWLLADHEKLNPSDACLLEDRVSSDSTKIPVGVQLRHHSASDAESILEDSDESERRGGPQRPSRASSHSTSSEDLHQPDAGTQPEESDVIRRRKERFLNRRTQSESSTGPARCRPDLSTSSQGASADSAQMDGSPKKGRFGAYKMFDSTRRAMQQYAQSSGSGISTPPSNIRSPRRTRSSDVGLRSGSPHPEERTTLRQKRRNPRRARSMDPSTGERSGSSNPSSRRGRRLAIMAFDGEDLMRGGHAHQQRRPPLRRTKSADESATHTDNSFSVLVSMKNASQGRRAENRSPQRKQSRSPIRSNSNSSCATPPPPSLRRAETAQSHTRSELSSMMPSHRAIRRIDSSLRAMKQFVRETGTSTEEGRRQSPKRIRSRLPHAKTTRSNSPKRWSEENNHGMSNSSPSIMGVRLRTSAEVTANGSHCVEDVSDSSHDRGLKRVTGRLKLDVRSGLGAQPSELAMDAMNSSSPAAMSRSGGLKRVEGRLQLDVSRQSVHYNTGNLDSGPTRDIVVDHSRRSKSSSIGDMNSSHSDMRLQAHNTRTAIPGSGPSSNEPSLHSHSDSRNLASLKTNHDHASSETLSEDSICVLEIGAHKEMPNAHRSLNLEDLDQKRKQAAAKVIPEDFNFSYPVPIKRERKHTVDWEALGFYSSFPASRKSYSEGQDEAIFSLPRRLVGQSARKALMSEVVVMAHRRQSMAAKKHGVAKVKRPAAKELLKELLTTFHEEQKTESTFADELAKTADALLEGDRVGRLSASARCFEEVNGRVSLDLGDVFGGSTAAQGAQQELAGFATCNQESTLSLSFRREFEESQKRTSLGFLPLQEENICLRNVEVLRNVFPFKRIQEQKRNAAMTTKRAAIGVGTSASVCQGSLEQVTASRVSVAVSVSSERLGNVSEEAKTDDSIQLHSLTVTSVEFEQSSQTAPMPKEVLARESVSVSPRTASMKTPVSHNGSQPAIELPVADMQSKFTPPPFVLSPRAATSDRPFSPSRRPEAKGDPAGAATPEFHLSFPPPSGHKPPPSPTDLGVSGLSSGACSQSLSALSTNELCGRDDNPSKIQRDPNLLRDIVISPHRMFGEKNAER